MTIEQAKKRMLRALKKYGANSPQYDKARNAYHAMLNTLES